MTDTLQQVLDTPGCERLRDFAVVGPAQRAALELFVDRIRAAEGEPMAWAISYDGVRPYSLWDSGDGPLLDLEVKRLGGAAKKMPLYTAPPKAAPEATQYIALCDAMGYNERTDNLTSPEEHAKSLVAEIKRLKHDPVAHSGWELREVLFDNGEPIGHREPKHSSAPMTDEEMILRGWRRCAVGQRTTQYCGQVEKAVAAEREACAKVLDDWKKHNWTFEDCAAVVRARGEK